MDSAVLLDLLGNENRRRILRLLSHKPCYVTEISEYLGVSPKAVIDHLRRLEEAGLIESRTDEKRRKYFHIARNLRLEVSVSPYRFGAKSAYPASRSLDMRGRCEHISIDFPASEDDAEPSAARDAPEAAVDEPEDHADVPEIEGQRIKANGGAEKADPNDVAALAREYAYLEDVESELSLAQRWVHGRVTDILDSLSERLGTEADSRFHAEVLAAIVRDARSAREVARELNASPERVETALDRLAERGLVEYEGSRWRIA
ncbi:ArsR family transcriptional regulator [Halobellus marinus]|jgi:ArsR family transcriptional regulator|uniref:ArsR family transcriptional regulator n=1 Tax=Halobellus TaxID=1073986 RepID=UPI0028AD98E3|nr:ArsR family transcriptional regulator [Halobellus sp. DFY28]